MLVWHVCGGVFTHPVYPPPFDCAVDRFRFDLGPESSGCYEEANDVWYVTWWPESNVTNLAKQYLYTYSNHYITFITDRI